MKRFYLLFWIGCFLFANTNDGVAQQGNIRSLIQGAKGKSNFFARLPADKQTTFLPSQAKALLGVDNNSDLVLMRAETDELNEIHYRYYQVYKGIPVENTMYLMHSKNGKLTGAGGTIILDFPKQMLQKSTAALSPDEALKRALDYVNAKTYAWKNPRMEEHAKKITGNLKESFYPIPSLAWYSPGEGIEPGNLKLSYKIDIYATEPLSRAYYFVDANTGQVLGKKDVLCYSDAIGTANTGYSGTQTIHSEFTGSSYRLHDITKGNGIITLNANTYADYTSATPDWTLTGIDQYALDAHYGISQTYDFYKINFNRNSINDQGYTLTSFANESATVNNAYWDGYGMHFGVRSTNGAGVDAIDVAGHELTHGVTEHTSNLSYSYESGAINESISDIMGKSVQFWSKPDDVNWLMSNDMNWLIRNLANPNQFNDPDTYHGTYWYNGSGDNGGVHTNSGVGNFMFYLLVTGGSGTNDIGNVYTVIGIGLQKADAIIYRSETVYLTPTSQYTDWRTACINAATDLYGAGSDEVIQVSNAWYAVGIGTAGWPSCSGTPTAGTIVPTTSSVCGTSSTTLILSGYTSGYSGITFQWQSSPDSINFTSVTGANTISYTFSSLSATTYFRCVVSCAAGGSATSNVSKITLSATPLAFNMTGGGNYCTGGIGVPVGLSGSEIGVNYQLKNGASNVGSPAAGTGSAISFGNQVAAGSYTVLATNVSSGCTRTMTGTTAVISDELPIATITAAGSTAICTGGSVMLNANTGAGRTYQWQLNGGTISGATSSSFSASAVGSYTCIVTNSCGNTTSNVITITVTGSIPSAVITAGGSTTFCSGGSVSLNANTETGFLYQWKFNGVPISSATASSYPADATGNYNCVVTNGCGNSTSNTIPVTVNSSPEVTASSNSPVCTGTTINLASNASNIYYNVSSIPFAPLSGSGTNITLGDDQMSGVLPIGFNFVFYGVSYTSLYISSNGFITFNQGSSSGCCIGRVLPNQNSIVSNMIAFAWTDLYPPGGGTIDYFTTGISPNRALVMRFTNIPHCCGTSYPVTSQVILYEGTNTIEIHTTSMPADGKLTTMGIENSGGTKATVVPGRNSVSNWSATNDAWRFTVAPTSFSFSWNGPDGLASTNQNPIISGATNLASGTYMVTVADVNGCTATANTTVTVIYSVLNLKLFIQGYYSTGGMMQQVMYNQLVDANISSTNTDTVLVELHSAVATDSVVATYKGILQTNGTIACSLPCFLVGNSYYIVVKHRNAIQTWSSIPVAFSQTTNYDFTTAKTMAYGSNEVQVEPGIYTLYTGDLNHDENIDLLDFPILDYNISIGLFGYYASDMNGDGNVDILDFPVYDGNLVIGVYSIHP